MKTLIAANWKMHGDSSWSAKPGEFARLFAPEKSGIECLICPPAYLLPILVEKSNATGVKIGAQNCHFEQSGAFTGEISAEMVADAGAEYIIVGHSERRAIFKESDIVVARKTEAVLRAGLKPIVCIGESETQRRAGREIAVVTRQLRQSVPKNISGDGVVVAYEPVWAIGTGLTPTLEDIAVMHDHIRKWLIRRFGEKTGEKIRILYGGSVKPANAKEILAIENVNGALVGGASLDMQSFAQIAAGA